MAWPPGGYHRSMVDRVLVPLAAGFEELEAVTIIDTLRRAGLQVVVAGHGGLLLEGSRGVHVGAEVLWTDVDPTAFDAIVLPGGLGGTEALAADGSILEALRRADQAGMDLAALCAAPLVLQAAGLLEGRRFTCHPSVEARLAGRAEAERVVVDGRLVTSQGPGTALEFSLRLVERWRGPECASRLREAMLAPR